MNSTSKTIYAGTTLIEVLISIVILGTFIILSTSCLSIIMGLAQTYAVHSRGNESLDQAVATLARDLDSASGRSVLIENETDLVFHTTSPIHNHDLSWQQVSWVFDHASFTLWRHSSDNHVVLYNIASFNPSIQSGSYSDPESIIDGKQAVSLDIHLEMISDTSCSLKIDLPW